MLSGRGWRNKTRVLHHLTDGEWVNMPAAASGLTMVGVNPRRLSQGDNRLVHSMASTTPGEFAASPVRKLRRQSLPARLSPPRQIEFNNCVDGGDPCRQIFAAADGAKSGKKASSSSTLNHLTDGQKVFYSRLRKA